MLEKLRYKNLFLQENMAVRILENFNNGNKQATKEEENIEQFYRWFLYYISVSKERISFKLKNKKYNYIIMSLIIPYDVMRRAVIVARNNNYGDKEMEILYDSLAKYYNCREIEIVKRMNSVAILNDYYHDEMLEIYKIDSMEDKIYKYINPVKLSIDANKSGEQKEPIDFLLNIDKNPMVTFGPVLKH